MLKRLKSGWPAMALVLAVPLCTSLLFGVTTKFWSSATYEDFARGSLVGVSLNPEGSMSIAPQLTELFSTDEAVIWAVAADQKGNTYLGTGHSGKVFKLSPDMKGSVFFEAPEPDIFALAVDKQNHLYVGTSPDGKIYKLDAAGKSQEFFDPQSKYIWAMTFAPDGSLYVGTGDRGKIFRVATNGKGELFYDTHQTHIMSLATAPHDELIAGSEPNGLLYRFSSAGKAFVLYDAPLSEIHRIVVEADGSIYASAMGSADDRRIGSPQIPVPSPGPVRAATTITVRAAQGSGILPGDGDSEPPSGDSGAAGGDASSASAGRIMPSISPGFGAGPRGGEGRGIKSAIYRISPDGTVDTLWDSRRESIFDLLPSGNKLLFSTDEKGHIYELDPDRHASLVTETGQEETTRLLADRNSVLAATANLGKIFRVGTKPADTGTYESEVRDTGGISSWGKIRWMEDTPHSTSIELLTRSGNSGRPDATWSDWSGSYRTPVGEQISSPPARYIQWKAVFHSADSMSPVLHEVEVPYLPRNQAPTVTDLKIVARADKAQGISSSGAGLNGASARNLAGFASSLRPAAQKGFDISWTANDPDQDELTYNLYFRGEGETEWKLLQSGVKQNYFQLSADLFADGKYRLKVVASDADVNPAGLAKTAETISAPFVVDNAPPLVEMKESKRGGDTATARFRAVDATSVLTRAEYVLDAEAPVAVLSDDGIIDSQEESFTITLSPVDGREHLLTLRVYDAAGNMGVAKALWPPSGSPPAARRAK